MWYLIPLFTSCLYFTAKKYRSIDEIKNDLEGYDLFPKTEAQIMLEHVKVLNDSSSTAEQKQKALDELEFLVHQVDNAKDLDIMGGLHLVVKALDDPTEGIRLRAAYVLGSAAQRYNYLYYSIIIYYFIAWKFARALKVLNYSQIKVIQPHPLFEGVGGSNHQVEQCEE